MSEAIQRMFLETGRMTMGTPAGHLRVTAEEAERRGIAIDEIAAWSAARGGWTERHEFTSKSLGPSYGKTRLSITFVAPEETIRGA